jgi:hypothetical protein
MIYNKMKKLSYSLLLVLAVSITSCTSNRRGSGDAAVVSGDYFGQTPPGDSARLFAPGIISTGMMSAISPSLLTAMRSSSAARQAISGM